MAEDLPPEPMPEALPEPPPAPLRRRRRPWFSIALLVALLLAVAGIVGALRWIDSAAGHRFLIARIAAARPASGLRIAVGGIEGSVFRQLRVTDVRFSDPRGRFASIATAELRWYPLAWFSNRLDIDRLHVGEARLDRLPQLRPTGRRKSVLPDFDIRLMDLRIDRLALGAALTGRPHALRAKGRIDIRSGRAVVDLDAAALDGADTLRLTLDSRPDADRFDLEAVATAPSGGLIGGLLGVREPLALAVRGDGRWSLWRGRFVVQRAHETAVNLTIEARAGAYHLRGPLALSGPLTVLGQGSAMLDADLRFEARKLSGTAGLTRTGMALSATGGVDLARSRFDDLRVDLRLADPARLASAVAGRPVEIKARLAGPFRTADLDLLLTAPELRQGGIVLSGLRLDATGRLAADGGAWRIALAATALQTGSAAIDGRLHDLKAQGTVRLAGGTLRLGAMQLRGQGLDAGIEGEATLANGALTLGLDAHLAALELAGLGQLDLDALIRLARPAGGRLALDGTVRAVLNRFDNGFLRGVAGGLPIITGRLALGADARVDFETLHLVAPNLMLDGEGLRARDGGIHIAARGTHVDYGPLALMLDGSINKPHIDLRLDRPGQGLRLASVHAALVPDEAGYQLTGEGQSALGPFTARGAVLLPPGGPARIDVAALRLGDVLARGTLVPGGGGLAGTLGLSGPADGSIVLSVIDSVQQLGLDIDLGSARFAGPLGLSVNRGQVKAMLTLRRHAVSIDGQVQARGVRYGSLRVGRLAGSASLVNGEGTMQLAVSAQNGRAFDLTARATVGLDRVAMSLGGTLDRQPMRFAGPAVLIRAGEDWRLEPTTLMLRGGRLTLNGQLGPQTTHFEARMRTLPLSVLDLVDSELGLGGTADGSLTYDLPRGGVPGGSLSLRIHGLTRSGLALSSAPIDIGVNASLSETRGAVRAVIADGGKIVGQAQALLTPFGPGSLIERINNAPLQAQIAYAGNADTLWRLTNIELLSLGGRVTIAARAGGTLADPRINGTVSAKDASLQSPATGMALTNITAAGSFDGAQLRLDNLHGETAGGGTVAGSAQFTFSGERGIAMAIALQADRAVLLDRDDIGATVTGPLRLRSDGGAGTISGDFDIVSSRFTLGRASAVAQIPQIRLIEINRAGDEVAPVGSAEPWRLEINATASSGLRVEGLGMRSQWAADLVISGPVSTPAISGTASLIEGSYDFAGKRFDLREGRLTFNGAVPVNPLLDIRAVADVSDLNATISVTGSSLRPIVTMSSIPALPQDELLSRLLFGTAITKLSAPEALQLASAVAAFQGNGGLDPINAVRRATGLSRLRILPADATTGQKTSIAAGKNIGRLYVELITDGQGYSATRVEFQITRWLSVLSSVSSIGRQSASARVSKDY